MWMFRMKIRNVFARMTICMLSTLTLFNFVNQQKVKAESTTDCRQLLTGTYLSTLTADFGSFRGITTFNRDGNFIATVSIQNGVPNVPPFSNTQGSWKCTSNNEIIATGLDFNYQTSDSPATISRTDINGTFNPKDGTLKETIILRTFDLNANPFLDNAPVVATFTVTGQRIKAEQ